MKYQRRIGDVVELTDQGIETIGKYNNNFSESNRPIFAKERNWSGWSISNLWIGILVSVLVYQVASGFIVAGMTWYQALFTVLLGHGLVMGVAVVIGHFGTKYGLSFPMICRAVFGAKGYIVPTIIRAVLGGFWFGVQAWIGGQAVNAIIGAIFPTWQTYGFTGLFISFLIFWMINIYVAASGSNAIRLLQNSSAPILIGLSFIVIAWALSAADWSLTSLLADPSLQGSNDANFWELFFPSLSAMIAFDAAIVISIADFTRFNKSQKAQFYGQVIGAPLMATFIAFVGICGTAGAAIVFNESIWEPAVLVSKFSNPFIVVLFSLFILVSILTTNVAGNIVPPINVMATYFSKQLTYKKAAYITGGLTILSIPWKVLENPDAFIFGILTILGTALGPICGVFMVGYLFAHKTNIDLVSLYRIDGGKYYYSNGWNVGAVAAFFIPTLLIIICKFIPPLQFIFNNSYVFGIIGASIMYYVYLKVSKEDVKYRKDDEHEAVSY